MAAAPITFITDFGTSGNYVAQMKGVVLGINPHAALVDMTHQIAPQDVRQAALVLDRAVDAFPPGTVHVAVIDPGVGSHRALLGVEMGGQRFLAPDNGLLSAVMRRYRPDRLHRLEEPRYWRQTVSPTFHGRDVLAPVAAHWSLGTDLAEFGPEMPQESLIMLPLRSARLSGRSVTGEIDEVDSFGNLITNIDEGCVPPDARRACIVDLGRTRIDGISRFYAEQAPGSLLALFGSSGRLEIAVSSGNAAEELGLMPGATVRVVAR